MDEKVIIETDRLILRQYRLEDADDIVDGLNNITGLLKDEWIR